MARTVLQGKCALVLGVDNEPGRACAQQLSRAGCRVLLASTNEERVEELFYQLVKKKGEPFMLPLGADRNAWEGSVREMRDTMGHIHLVVNALAYSTNASGEAGHSQELARWADGVCYGLLQRRGPLRMLTLWPEDSATPEPVAPAVWHGHVLTGQIQGQTDEAPPSEEEKERRVLKAGGVADSIVCLLQLPPGTRPTVTRLEAIPTRIRPESESS